MFDRRQIVLSTALGFLCGGIPSMANSSTAVPLGAIRWDPWYAPEGDTVRSAVERTLSPEHWHFRAPSCATVIDKDHLSYSHCAQQDEIEREIKEAHRAGIDYWAYVWYGRDNGLQKSWQLHQNSVNRQLVKWCMIAQNVTQLELDFQKDDYALKNAFIDPGYQKVLNGRPIIFVFEQKMEVSTISKTLSRLRLQFRSQKVNDPYIVILDGDQSKSVQEYDADAIGMYSKEQAAPVHGDYAELAMLAKQDWATLAATKQPMVPTALTGADRRPRVEHPVDWEKKQNDSQEIDRFFSPGSPKEIASHIKELVEWIKSHRSQCPAQTGLIYSWSEYDEGGSTLGPSLSGDYSILNAVGSVLGRKQ